MGHQRQANTGGNCSWKLRRYVELWIVQLRVCHRKCFSKSSVYLFTRNILQELSFQQTGYAYVTFYVKGAQPSLACLLPTSCVQWPWWLLGHILCPYVCQINCFGGCSLFSTAAFIVWIYVTQVNLLVCSGQPKELWFTFICVYIHPHMFIKLQGSTRKFLCQGRAEYTT